MRIGRVILCLAAGSWATATGCGSPVVLDVHLGDIVDAAGEGEALMTATLRGEGVVNVFLDGQSRIVEIAVAGESGIRVSWRDRGR